MRTRRLIIIFGILLSLTLVVAISSAVFSIRRIDAYCYNFDDPPDQDDLDQLERIINGKYDGKKSIKDMLVGKNIFSLDEAELITEVESREGGIKVINIERLFPNRVFINYIKLHEYFEVEYKGKYYLFGKDGKVVDTLLKEDPGYINIKMKLLVEPTKELSELDSFAYLTEIIEMVERLGYDGTAASGIIEFIDLDKKPNYIYIKMRSGVFIEISDLNDIGNKVRSALSLYDSDASIRLKGTIIVGKNENIIYSPNNRYEEVK